MAYYISEGRTWVNYIIHHRKKIYSQCGEEGFIEYILESVGVKEKGLLVEFGAGDGITLSNSHYFIKEKGFKGLRVDGDPKGADLLDADPFNASFVYKGWINTAYAEDFAADLNKYVTKLNLFLIDLDGNDWYILNAFIETLQEDLRPELVVCEINPIWERDEARVIAYNPSHVWKNNTYYGMSLKAAEIMMQKHGYTLIFVNDSLNAYFLKNELLPATPYPVEYRVKRDHPKGSGPWMQVNEDLTLKPL